MVIVIWALAVSALAAAANPWIKLRIFIASGRLPKRLPRVKVELRPMAPGYVPRDGLAAE
jgi:hypothetical protein